jgi:hypothetical protein
VASSFARRRGFAVRAAPGLSSPRIPTRVGVALVSVLIAVNTVALAVHLGHRSTSDNSPAVAAAVAPDPTVTAAAAWVVRELPHDARIIADRRLAAALTRDRFTAIRTPSVINSGPAGGRIALTFDYAVSTAALRATAGPGSGVDRVLTSSVPIAMFGSGSGVVLVRQASTADAADLAASRAADLQKRRAGERQLLANPAIHAGTAARTALHAGRLDLRAATVLALMANSSHVDLLSVNIDRPEQLVGLPARSIDVRTDAESAVEAMLSNLPPSYRPTSDSRLPGGAHRMVWPIVLEPPTGLN